MRMRRVAKYTTDGKWIKDYGCIADAAKDNNISSPSISNMLNGRTKTAGGYVWRPRPFNDKEMEDFLDFVKTNFTKDYDEIANNKDLIKKISYSN